MSPGSEARAAGYPVCGVPFRGRADCPRCGADLRAVMRVRIAAWRLRNRARAALRAGDAGAAGALAREAARFHATPEGRALHVLAAAVEAADVAAAERARSVHARSLQTELERAENAVSIARW